MAVYKRGKKWWIAFQWRNRRYQRPSLARTKTEARHELYRWKDEVRAGKRTANIRYCQLAEQFLKTYAIPQLRAWRRVETGLKPICKFMGEVKLADLTPGLIMEYRAARSTEVRPGTVNRELVILRRSLNLAVVWGYLSDNPVRKLRPLMLKDDGVRNRVLLSEEEARLLAAPTRLEPLKDIIRFILNTGLRPGEALGLTWSDVRLPFRHLVVPPKLSKNGKTRIVPLNAITLDILRRRQQPGFVYVFAARRQSEPISYQRFYRAFRRLSQMAGVQDLRPHDLRHTFATRLVAGNVSLVTIRDLLGHSGLRTTERYAHASGHQEAVESLVPVSDDKQERAEGTER